MFNQLTRYMFEQWLPQTRPSIETEVVAPSPKITTAETGDDWVVVFTIPSDDESSVNSRSSSIESLHHDDAHDDDMYTFPSVPTVPLLRASSDPRLDDSWYLTPPPCFIRRGPIHMQTSSLENLLIEHPSMSVYTVHRRHLGPEEADHDVVEKEGSGEDDDGDGIVVVDRVPRPYQHQLLERQAEEYRLKAQKVLVRDKCRSLNRNSLDRTNRARELNGRNQRQRRSERSQSACRSYANNNRKC